MAFPTTSVLDNFNRANETPLSSAGMWTASVDGTSAPNLSGNQVKGPSTAFYSMRTDASYAAHQEAFITIPTLPVAGRLVSLFLRLQSSNIGTSNFTGYQFQCVEDGSGNYTFKIYYQSAGSATLVAQQTVVALSAGDKIGAEASGSTLTFYKFHSGAWSSVVSGTDSNISAGGFIGFEIQRSELAVDDFGGGDAVASSVVAPFISSGTTMYAPALTPSGVATVTAPFISSSTTVYTPSIGDFIVAPFIERTGTVYTPTLGSSGTGAIAAPFIPSSTTIYTPGIFKPVVSHGITGADATAITFYVDHLDHDGSVIATFQPINLRWTYRLGQDGPGEVFYGIALSDPALTRDGFAPYATDFLLRVDITDGVSTNSYDLMAGPHTPVNMKLVDGAIEGVVWVSGQDWLHWLDQPYTSWDYDTPIDEIVATLDPTKLHGIYSAANGDTISDVILALLEPLSDDPTEQIVLTPEFNGTAFDETVDYVLWRTDGTNVSDHLKTLAHLQDPKGFDFWVEPDKTLKFFGPHRMNPNFVTPVFFFGAGYTGAAEFNPLVGIDWTNNGPLATKTIGLGNGQSNTTRYSTSTYQPSVDLYRRWVRFADLTDTTVDADAQHQVDALTDMRGYLDRFPQKELRLTVKPEFADPTDAISMFLHQCAAVIDVDFDFAPYHRIDAEFYITSQEFYMDAAGNVLCDLTLDQIYA